MKGKKPSNATNTTNAPSKPVKQRTTPERYYAVARAEVFDNKDFLSALLTAGYKEGYARTNGYLIRQDDRYRKIVSEYKQKMHNECTYNVHTIQRNAQRCMESCIDNDTIIDRQAYLKANEQLGRTIAAFVDKSITQTEDVKPMTPAERAIMSRLAKVYLEAKFSGAEGVALVDDILDAEPLQPSDNETDNQTPEHDNDQDDPHHRGSPRPR